MAAPARRAAADRGAPERFLEQALVALLRLPSVAGVQWRAGAEGERQSGELGSRTAQRFTTRPTSSPSPSTRATGSAGAAVAPAPARQLLGEFYAAKLREEKLRQASYLQAVRNRRAHDGDIKNLLQSLSVLTSVAREDETRNPAQLQALLRRRLLLIERRLADTLAKFQRPQAGRAMSVRGPGGKGSRASTAPRAWSSSRKRLLQRPAAALAFRHGGG